MFWLSNDKLLRKLPWLLLLSIVVVQVFSGALLAQTSNSEQLHKQAKKNISSALECTDKVEKELARKNVAHKILSKALGNNIPEDLARELIVEIEILATLIKSNNQVTQLTTTAQTIANGQTLEVNIENIAENLSALDKSLKNLRDKLETKSEARKRFKIHLKEVVNALIIAKPNKVNTYITVTEELDPKSLDIEIMQQRTIIASVLISLKELK